MREAETEKSFHPLFHCSNSHNGWGSQELRALFRSSKWDNRDPDTWVNFYCFSQAMSSILDQTWSSQDSAGCPERTPASQVQPHSLFHSTNPNLNFYNYFFLNQNFMLEIESGTKPVSFFFSTTFKFIFSNRPLHRILPWLLIK